MTGTVNNINLTAKTITIVADDGSDGTFKDFTNSDTRIDFDKRIRAGATEVDTFNKKDAYVIVFYFGEGNMRTAVAVRNLGSGPFIEGKGTITKFEGRAHLLSVQDGSGTIGSFRIAADTGADTGLGIVDGFKFQPHKDDQVQVVTTLANGSATALFVSAM
ncbi:MAG: hypothetical protein ABSD59_14095 [Terracidiphilus sp.]|jgi:hypothetical protein